MRRQPGEVDDKGVRRRLPPFPHVRVIRAFFVLDREARLTQLLDARLGFLSLPVNQPDSRHGKILAHAVSRRKPRLLTACPTQAVACATRIYRLRGT